MQKVKWPGRNQVILRKQIAFYLDGAHTVESLQVRHLVHKMSHLHVITVMMVPSCGK